VTKLTKLTKLTKKNVIAEGYQTLESPLWSEKYGLVVSDATLGGVFSVQEDGSRIDLVKYRRGIGGFAFHQDGGIIVGGRNLAIKRPAEENNDETIVILDNDPENDVVGFNDMTVDSQGRIYVGSLGFVASKTREGKAGQLFLIDIDGKSRVVADDIKLTNGLCFSPDGKILYHADSNRQCVYSYKVFENGDLGERQIFIESDVGKPDGLVVDMQGNVWVALPHSGEAHCYSSNKEVIGKLKVDEPMITSLGFGGSDMRDLFVVSGSEGSNDECAGKIYRVRMDVSGFKRPLAQVRYC